MFKGRYDLLEEHLLVKEHRGRVVAGVEGDAPLPPDVLVESQADALLRIKPQAQGGQAAAFEVEHLRQTFRRREGKPG